MVLIHFFLDSWNPKKMGKLTSFGVDIVFLIPGFRKKLGKLTSFGIDELKFRTIFRKKIKNYDG